MVGYRAELQCINMLDEPHSRQHLISMIWVSPIFPMSHVQFSIGIKPSIHCSFPSLYLKDFHQTWEKSLGERHYFIICNEVILIFGLNLLLFIVYYCKVSLDSLKGTIK